MKERRFRLNTVSPRPRCCYRHYRRTAAFCGQPLLCGQLSPAQRRLSRGRARRRARDVIAMAEEAAALLAAAQAELRARRLSAAEELFSRFIARSPAG